MKKGILIVMILILTGCSKNALIGTWKTEYEIKGIGKIEEKYTFKDKGKCVRSIVTTTTINTDCTYKFNKNNTKIQINWENKLYKDNYDEYKEIDKKNIKIGSYTYTKV